MLDMRYTCVQNAMHTLYICSGEDFSAFLILLLFIYIAVVDQLPRLRKRELICLLLFTCN